MTQEKSKDEAKGLADEVLVRWIRQGEIHDRLRESIIEGMGKVLQEPQVIARLGNALLAAFETVKEREAETPLYGFIRLFERNLHLYRKRIPKSLFTNAHAQRWAATHSVQGSFRAFREIYFNECRRIFEEQLSDLSIVSEAEGLAKWEQGLDRSFWRDIDQEFSECADRQRSEMEEKLKYFIWALDNEVRSEELDEKERRNAWMGEARG